MVQVWISELLHSSRGMREWRMDFLASKTLKKQCLGEGQALKNDAGYSASNSSASHHSLAVMPADKCKPRSTPVEYNQRPKKLKVLGVDMPRTSAQMQPPLQSRSSRTLQLTGLDSRFAFPLALWSHSLTLSKRMSHSRFQTFKLANLSLKLHRHLMNSWSQKKKQRLEIQ